MTKQENLAMRLPYGLKYKYLNGTYCEFDAECYKKVIKYDANYSIILRPLSDLTKPIEHKGEKFVPIVKLGWGYDIIGWSKSNIIAATKNLTLKDALMLCKWHFDIDGLIESGEAIDVNTLEVNPYK